MWPVDARSEIAKIAKIELAAFKQNMVSYEKHFTKRSLLESAFQGLTVQF